MLLSPGDSFSSCFCVHGTAGASIPSTSLAAFLRNGNYDGTVTVSIAQITDAFFGGSNSNTDSINVVLKVTNGAGILDYESVFQEKLSPGGLATAANQASLMNAVNAITTNTTRGKMVTPYWFVRPASGSVPYEIDVMLYTLGGQFEDPDSQAVTIHVRNTAGTSLDAALSSTTMTRISFGKYKVTYTVNSTDPVGELIFDATWQVGSMGTGTSDAVEVQDAETIATLNAINTKLGTPSTTIAQDIASNTTLVGNTLSAASSANSGVQILLAETHPPLAGGTLAGASSNTASLQVGASLPDGSLVGNLIHIVSGSGSGQTRPITGYTNSGNIVSVSPAWTVVPDTSSGYIFISDYCLASGGVVIRNITITGTP
jgi:hypothetical protein